MFSFSCFSCISSKKAIISFDISNIDQTIPIIQNNEPIIDVSNITNKNILYYFKILKEPDEKEISTDEKEISTDEKEISTDEKEISKTRLEDSKSEFIPADSDSNEEEICVILANNPPEYSQPRIITPIQDESREPTRTPLPKIDIQ